METRRLAVQLTDEQVESRSRQFASGYIQRKKEEDELALREKASKDAFKAEHEALARRSGELDALASSVATRKITTDVDCDWFYHLGEGTEAAPAGFKILVRRDNKEAIERRPLTSEERQLVIGEKLEEANADQLKLWEEQLAKVPVSEEEAAKKEDDDEEDDEENGGDGQGA
jgi:hypothetical protein